MYTQNQVNNKIDELIAYSVTTDPTNESSYISFGETFKLSVADYFEMDRSSFNDSIRDLRYAMHSDLMVRGSLIETPFDLNLREDAPAGYSDLRNLFYDFPIMLCTNEEFYNSWVRGTQNVSGGVDGETSTVEVILYNSLFNAWSADLSASPTTELNLINNLVNWIDDSLRTHEGITFWESDYKVISQPENEDIAYDLFINRGFKEVITTLGFREYIPSYV